MIAMINGTLERIALAIPIYEEFVQRQMNLAKLGVENRVFERLDFYFINKRKEVFAVWRFYVDWERHDINVRTEGRYIALNSRRRKTSTKKPDAEKAELEKMAISYEEISTELTRRIKAMFDYTDRYVKFVTNDIYSCGMLMTPHRKASSAEYEAFRKENDLSISEKELADRVINFSGEVDIILNPSRLDELTIEHSSRPSNQDSLIEVLKSVVPSVLKRA